MVTKEEIVARLNARVSQVLEAAELGMHAEKFPLFRRVVLNAFGKTGFVGDLEALISRSRESKFGTGTARHGTGRNDFAKKGGAP